MLHYFDLAASLAICAIPRKVGLQNCVMGLTLRSMNKNIILLAAASPLLLIPSLASAAPVKSNDDMIAGLPDNACEPNAFAMISDFGAGQVLAVDFNLPNWASALRTQIASALAPLGVVPRKDAAGCGADVGAIIAAQKLGIIDLRQDGTKYFDMHHAPDETLDKIDNAELSQNVATWVATMAYVANYDSELKPEHAQ